MMLALHLLTFLLLPPLLPGVISRVKALVAGRVGPPLLQPYYDLARLARKNAVTSDATSAVFALGPAVSLVAVAAAALLLPIGPLTAPLSFTGDAVLFIYLLALARLFTTLAALDTGSAFEGMGAAREAAFGALAEPSIMLALLVLARHAGALSLQHMVDAAGGELRAESWAPLALVGGAMFMILLVENCRIPFDDPNTHLELTMIHEVMVLDHSGPLLGAILYGAAIKLFIFASLLLTIFSPPRVGVWWGDYLIFVGGLLGVAVLVGVVESVMARLRLIHIPTMLLGVSLICALAFVLSMGK